MGQQNLVDRQARRGRQDGVGIGAGIDDDTAPPGWVNQNEGIHRPGTDNDLTKNEWSFV